MKLTQSDVRFLRECRREFGPKTAWTAFGVVLVVTWYRESEIAKAAGMAVWSVLLYFGWQILRTGAFQ